MALVVVDAAEGLVDLDLQIAYEAQRAKCATAVLFNKWDISTLDLDMATARVKAKVQMKPRWLTVSALTRPGSRPHPAAGPGAVRAVQRAHPHRRAQPLAGGRARSAAARRQGEQDHQDLLHGAVRDVSPPRFKVMVNSRALVNKSFAYYLENRLREDYGLWGIPLVIDFEGKEERYS